MKEKEARKVKRTLEFESSGETLAIEIEITNVSPEVKKETIYPLLDTLYERTKEAIF